MNPLSPSSEKKRRQWLKMSLEAKEAQREKSKFAIQMKRELETKEQTALAKDKHREKKRLKMRKTHQAETEEQTHLHREINKLAMKRKHKAETEEETKSDREKQRLSKSRKRQAMTEEQTNLHNEKVRLTMKRKREAETEEETNWHSQKNKLAKTRNRQAIKKHCHSETEVHKDNMEDVISRSKKEAMKFIHRTKDPKNPHKHRAIVCIICNRCIIGTEAICKLTKAQISLLKKWLGVDSYEEFYETTLKPEVTKQYQINVDDFKGMLLSPRSRKYLDGYATCVSVECNHIWQPKKILPNFRKQMDL